MAGGHGYAQICTDKNDELHGEGGTRDLLLDVDRIPCRFHGHAVCTDKKDNLQGERRHHSYLGHLHNFYITDNSNFTLSLHQTSELQVQSYVYNLKFTISCILGLSLSVCMVINVLVIKLMCGMSVITLII